MNKEQALRIVKNNPPDIVAELLVEYKETIARLHSHAKKAVQLCEDLSMDCFIVDGPDIFKINEYICRARGIVQSEKHSMNTPPSGR